MVQFATKGKGSMFALDMGMCGRYFIMPFKSEKQRRWMHANKPAMAKEWEEEEKRGRRKRGMNRR